MEQRENERFTVNFDVVICYDGIGLIRGDAVNLSATGVFVASNAVVLPMNSQIKAAFSCDTEEGKKQLSLEAKVIRSSTEGVALQFEEGTIDKCVALSSYLASRRQTSRHTLNREMPHH